MDAGGARAEEEENGREEASVRVKSPPRFLHGAAARQSRAGPGTGGSQPPCEAGNLGENQFPAPVYPNYSRGSRVAQGRGWIPARSWLTPRFNFGLFGKRGAPGNVAGMGMSGLRLRFHLDSGSGSSNPLGISQDPQIPLEKSFPGKPSGILSL